MVSMWTGVPVMRIAEAETVRLLTMERLEGIKVNDLEALRATGLDLSSLARRGAEMYMEMILGHGFYHADPHPGNLLILPGNVIGLIDFGSVSLAACCMYSMACPELTGGMAPPMIDAAG